MQIKHPQIVEKAVDFLLDNESLRQGDSPWDFQTEDEEAYLVDWNALFRGSAESFDGENATRERGPDSVVLDFDGAVFNALTDALAGDPSDVPTEGATTWEPCAWYQPIHYFGYSWGIYIREECIINQAIEIAWFLTPGTQATKALMASLFRISAAIYFLHEHFHHKVESLGFRLHVTQRRSAYLAYMNIVYKVALNTDAQLEEALANADSYRRIANKPYSNWFGIYKPAVRTFLKWKFSISPPGYRKAVDYLDKEAFEEGENQLQARVSEANQNPNQPASEFDLAPHLLHSLLHVKSRIWFVVPRGKATVAPRGSIQPVATCSTSRLVQLCELEGYTQVRGGKGSHVKLKKPHSPMIVIPGNRRELSPDTADTTLKILGHRLSDLPDLLSNL